MSVPWTKAYYALQAKKIEHLSDGTPILLVQTSATTIDLCYLSSSRNIVTVIATLVSGTGGYASDSDVGLCRDADDNIYVAGVDSSGQGRVRLNCFTKGAGYSWTDKGSKTVTSGSSFASYSMDAVWCNTGGSTNGKGHILICSPTGYAFTFSAGDLIAGNTPAVYLDDPAVDFAGANAGQSAAPHLSPDGFGAVKGLGFGRINNQDNHTPLGAWEVGSNGLLVTNTVLGNVSGIRQTNGRIVRVASNKWMTLTVQTTGTGANAGIIGVELWSFTAQLNAVVTKNLSDNMAFGLNAVALVFDGTKCWVLYRDGTDNATLRKIGVSTATPPVWDANSTVVQTSFDPAATGPVKSDIFAIERAVATKPIDYMGADQAAFGGNALGLTSDFIGWGIPA